MEKKRKRLNKMNISGIERKTLLLAAMLLTCGVASAQVVVKGSVYGGGQGIKTDENAGLVTGNATVTMNGGTVERSIYGGGQLGSVGTFTEYTQVEYDNDLTVNVPKRCAQGTGLATVTVNGGHVGKNGSLMGVNPNDDDRGWIFCGGRGEADSITYPKAIALGVVGSTHLTFGTLANATQPLVTASVYGGCENGLVLENTHVEIRGGQIGTGLVSKTQGENNVWTGNWDAVYVDTKWTAAINAVRSGNASEINAAAGEFHECDAWPYGDGNDHYYVYDIYAGASGYDSHGGALQGSTGQTFFGCVFGGGSGYYPIRPGVWRRTAGQVNGNTLVEVTGGHILTSIYGGNEMTDVKGTCTVNMTGGTLGVPRTLAQIKAHPVTCYLFGAGRGDQRVLFNKWTNVQNAVVNIGGDAFFFGSVFGGGEDGHVLGDVTVNINNLASGANNAYIGTWGYSYVDGNVFGGGRGFSGEGITCGSVGGDITVNINGGNILGSIYGGGRMASAGIGFALELDPIIGYFQPDIPDDPETPEDESETHGHVTINISGGTIGNDYESKLHLGNPDLEGGRTHGGNVFGGSMGRLTKLDGSINPKWPILGQVKTTEINIAGDNTIIKGNVYGGGEFGLVLDSTEVNVRGGTIWRNVYGGGYGSNDNTTKTDIQTGQAGVTFRYTPMAFAGVVSKKTFVNISGGWVKKNVYGGGEMASVGLIDYRLNNAGTDFENITKHDNEASSFALSWPYDYQYFTGFDGNTHVEITGGRIGITGKDFMGPWNASGTPLVIPEGGTEYVAYDGSDAHKKALKAARQDNGDVYGGGHGIAGDRYDLAFCANANNTVVTVNYATTNAATPDTYKPSYTGDIDYEYAFYAKASDWQTYGALGCLSGSLYGGGENGHVNDSTIVTLNNGLIGHSVYGGGKGSDKYEVTLLDPETNQPYQTLITSITAGKVFGNTYVNMNGGYVVRNVFGGGNRASVGKGNYASGPNDFTPQGYGEQWTAADDEEMQALFDNSGHTYVNIYGGIVGTVNGMKDDMPTGSVFGSSRGEPAPNVRQTLTPRIHYYPEFFLGYVNHTHVTIGEADSNNGGTSGNTGTGSNGPRLFGSVFGGGQDGHVRWDAEVTVNKGEIGNKYDAATIELVGTDNLANFQWRGRGSVYGAGAGLGMYTDATGSHYSTSAGSVTQFTTVTINGGIIHQNVYGGGPLSSVGPPAMGQTAVPSRVYSLAQVNIHSAIGDEDVVIATENNPASAGGQYGGSVFGAGRGVFDFTTDPLLAYDKFATSMFSEVNLYDGAYVPGDVFGGGQLGQVKNDTKVNMIGGTVGTIGYVRKHNTASGAALDSIVHTSGGGVFGGGAGYPMSRDAALVKGNTEVNISGGHVLLNVYGGGELASVGLREQYTYTTGEGNEQTEHTDYRPKLDDHNKPTGLAKVNVTGGQVGPAPGTGTYNGQPYNVAIGQNVNGVDGYVFGGGKGDVDNPAFSFKEFADVNYTSVKVNIPSEADNNTNRIWGCVFGGAEDGHVLGSDTVYFASGMIGSTGFTGFDGHIFGGGKGSIFTPVNSQEYDFTTGRVRGNTKVEMTGGTALGNIYGGGDIARTGVGFDSSFEPFISTDGETHVYDSINHGMTEVIISGGTIGNNQNNGFDLLMSDNDLGNVYGGGRGTYEDYIEDDFGRVANAKINISGIPRIYSSIFGGGQMANVGHWNNYDELYTEKTGATNVTISGSPIIGTALEFTHYSDEGDLWTWYDTINNVKMISHTCTGNVFGGGQGDVEIDYGEDEGEEVIDDDETVVGLEQGHCRTTLVDISGEPIIMSSVFGGGEDGMVWGDTKVKIAGGIIGTQNILSDSLYKDENGWHVYEAEGYAAPRYSYGNVFGGSFGKDAIIHLGEDDSHIMSEVNSKAGLIHGNTYVEITGGAVRGNVFGGGNYASVKRNAEVVVNGGSVGPLDGTGLNAYVFGGGKGFRDDTKEKRKAFANVANTKVTVGGGTIYGSVFGGGSDAHVLADAEVNVAGGLLGTTGTTTWDGNIFGGGRNFMASNLTNGRVGGNITVNMKGGTMLGSIFGGGRLANTGIDMDGEMQDGEEHGYVTVNVGDDDEQNTIIIGHAFIDHDDRVGGNVYGGGKGIAGPPSSIYPRLAKVKQTEVNIRQKSGSETWIEGSVFGGGEDGHVLQDTYVNIYGGQIGGESYGELDPCDDVYHGNVYGGGRGVDTYEDPENPGTYLHSHTAGWVQGNTNVNMVGGNIIRNVYGGGNIASVGIADENPQNGQYSTGLASVTITGGTVGTIHENENFGNVFGSGHGGVGGEYVELAFVKNTHVTIGKTARVYGSVFGGGEDGHVRKNALVDIEGGIIGDADDANPTSTYYNTLNGNVYGGGRGLLTTVESETAGEVYGYTIVNIKNSTDGSYSPVVWNNVYGGGSQSVVHDYKVVNMSGGLIHGSLFGGSREIPASRPNKAPRWVNMWGGTVEGNVYGCSYYAEDGDPANDEDWASFVNISGGTIGTNANGGIEGGNVYGAGYGGKVKGSVAVLIGQNAIVETSNASGDEFYGENIHRQETPVVANLDIKGSVFGGSYGSIGSTDWDHSFNVSGYSRIYIDGTGYNTTISAPAQTTNYMNIGGGVYGCGTNCESGEKGRDILVRNYGTRNPSRDPNAELTQASRTLTTLQRGDIIMLDNTNVNLSGATDISQSDSDRAFAVLQVNKGVYVTNASGIVLGAVGAPAYMDSIHEVRSLHLRNASTSYGHLDGSNANDWEWIGVNPLVGGGNTQENARLYYTQTNPNSPLVYNQENVIVFNGDSRLYVRYLDKTGGNKKRMYGQLQGFFRMRGDFFQPVGTESFAYARPKVTPKNNPIAIDGYNFTSDIMNGGDGGFLSYNTDYNFFTSRQTVLYYTYTTDGDDGGSNFTKTKQYPYFNIGEYVQNKANGEMDLEEFREWVLPRITGKIWYVDGRGIGNGGWGKDANHQAGWGHFPDKPKLTVSGDKTITEGGNTVLEQGICYDESVSPEPLYPAFDKANDIIYVVGPIDAVLEKENLNRWPDYQLKLYRYPGGHMMSNGKIDNTVVDASHPAPVPSSTYDGLVNEGESSTMDASMGPGANLGMMIHANKSNFVMENVLVDGLHGATTTDVTTHNIPTSFTSTQMYKVDKPMVVTTANNTLTLKGRKNIEAGTEAILANGTVLQRGYNNTDAATTWYSNADYDCYSASTVALQGGGLFVDKDATVNVEGLVTITGSKQRRLVGSDDRPVNSNVYLPTFLKHLNITDELNEETRIGVTSPIRNTAEWYYDNTLSPVAKAEPAAPATMAANQIAAKAWQNCNFLDDQNWFFVSGNKTLEPASPRTTYYVASGTKDRDNKTLYFGWTWASVVRTEPTGFSATAIDTPEELAWLITKDKFQNEPFKQTADLDMKQYVWVPIGNEVTPFIGNYDGQGHLIKNLYIDYIGTGDLRYELTDYGLFGHVRGGTIDRTFVVSGKYQPVVSDLNGTAGKNIGGLVGSMYGTSKVSNSEAAVMILGPNLNDGVTGNAIGGLVANMIGGEIHSSMTMSTLSIGQNYKGTLGGLVGKATGGNIYNAFANVTFDVSSNNEVVVAGGLLGINAGATVVNCYANWLDGSTSLSSTNFGRLAASNTTADNMKQCYAMGNTTTDYSFAVTGGVDATCKRYSDVISADMLGYMYHDNKIEGDTAMFIRLNEWVDRTNGANLHKYARWARPGLAEINGDLPVLLISDLSSADVESTDDFRSLASYEKGKVLQYGGTARDGSDKHLSEMLKRDEYVFVYGDVDGHDELGFDGDEDLATVTVNADKVSIYEHASIKYPGQLANLGETYVGITFDNSFGHATSTPGVNVGLNGLGIGPYPLPRDWHMFSTPLNNAPQGFDYGGDNVPSGPSNNPWESSGSEFSWLTVPGSDECASGAGNRYWMKEFVATEQKTDGYFPTRRGSLFDGHVNDLFIVGSDECPSENGHRYPYGMDFYTWTEPDYHWINFKRNGPNHWHSDEPHEHLDYVPVQGATANQNEDKLIVGRGYMAAITTGTFMQSHGILNEGEESIPLTLTSSSKLKGWNLVGNPYHGYLDFDMVAKGNNLEVLSDENYFSGNADEGAFYVVYNADKYQNQDASTAFRYYPVHGSTGGDYAERYLHPHQGFYVRAKAEGNLTFNESMLVPRSKIEGESTFRDERPAYPLVNLYLSSDQGCADVTVIEFERPEWGGATKLKELRVGDGLFYAQHDNTHYAALFAQQGIDRVPVWFEAKEDDIFTLKWNTANADFHSMYLIDHITGIEYDMLRNDTYTFEGHKGDYPSRFLIVFSLTDVEEHNEIQTFVFFDGSQWIVTGDGQLDFVDPLGQVLMSKEVHGGQSRVGVPDVAPGVYLFRLTNSEGTRIQKVVVKR